MVRRIRVDRFSVLAYNLGDYRILRRNYEKGGRQGMSCLERQYEDEEAARLVVEAAQELSP
jgi:hypothetical protein